MKKIILLLIIFIPLQSFPQAIKEQLEQVKSIADAEKLAVNNPNLETEIFNIHPEIDSDSLATKLSSAKRSEIFSDLNCTYKILSETDIAAFRVSYIFLDATKISLAEIEKLRTEIVKEYKNGISFSNLANKYTMDSSKDGDLGWFAEGMMVPDFEKAVKDHKQNDIFKVNIPDKKWYYIVLKTFEDKKVRRLTVLKINNNT